MPVLKNKQLYFLDNYFRSNQDLCNMYICCIYMAVYFVLSFWNLCEMVFVWIYLYNRCCKKNIRFRPPCPSLSWASLPTWPVPYNLSENSGEPAVGRFGGGLGASGSCSRWQITWVFLDVDSCSFLFSSEAEVIETTGLEERALVLF